MGKNLKGKECGKGIYQRKDGLFSARFVSRTGKRYEKYFQALSATTESDMQPKVLQKLLDHASIKTTMDRYVHVTTESLDQAVRQFQLNGVL